MAALVLSVLATAALPAVGHAASPGQLYAFGSNQEGQLGVETNFETKTPNPTPALVTLPGEVGTVTQAATGVRFSLAVTSGGQLYAFGEDGSGELGYRPKGREYAVSVTPKLVTLPGEVGGVIQAAAGFEFGLVVTSGGQLYSFGQNWEGSLGDDAHGGYGGPNPVPALVTLPGATGPVVRVAAGAFHSLALTATGQLYSFGQNFYGELGRDPMYTLTPALVTLPGASGPVTQIAAGEESSLAVTATGQLYAFGENRNGELGSATNMLTTEPNPVPARVTLPGEVGPVTQVAAGTEHSLALTASGQLYAFGDNQEGQLGNTTNLGEWWPNPTPTLVRLPGASGRIVRTAAGQQYSLALTSTGELYAFGSDYWGELGFPPRKKAGREADLPNPTPTRVALPANVETMATGDWADQTLVVLADLALSSASLPGGEAGLRYSAQVQATGGAPPYTWSASGLPTGLSIDPTTGAISGAPAVGGSYTPTITATDSFGIEASAQLALPVRPLPLAPRETAPLSALTGASPLSLPRGASPPRASPFAAQPLSSPRGRASPLSSSPPHVVGAAKTPARKADSLSPNAHADSHTFSPSSWIVHKYLGQITKAGARSLDKPVGLAFDPPGDLFVTDADDFESGVTPTPYGYLDRYGPTGELECEVTGFPWGEVNSVAVNDETGDVYVAEVFLYFAGVWLFTPEGKCYKAPTGVEEGGLMSLTVDNGPGSRRGDVYTIDRGPPYGEAAPYDYKPNGKGELEGVGSELPEPPDEFSGGGEFGAGGIAVDPTSGAIYLANPKDSGGEVDVYDKEDELQPRTLTTGEPFEPIAVAVDPTDGEVYVVNAVHRVIDEFNSSGEYIGQITGAHTPAGKFSEPRDVAVKPSTHEIYVSDEGTHAIDIFGADEEAGPAPAPATESASEVGTGSATLNGAVERAEGEPLSWFFRYAEGSSCNEPDGEPIERKQFASGEHGLLHEHMKIEKLAPSTEYSVCFSDEGAEGVLGAGTAVHFKTGGLAPAASAVSVFQITPSSAVLTGSANPQNQSTTYRFEYATNAAFAGASVASEGSFARGVYPEELVDPADLSGLAPDTTYYVRLYAENSTGHYTTPGTSFTTLSPGEPAVEFWGAGEGETVSQARLEGHINPGYASTTCAFQYTPESDYALKGFAGAAEAPCASSPFGSAEVGFSEAVTATASGLQAGVTYDYRLIAHSTDGAAEGPVAPATATFATVGPPNPSTGAAEGLAQHSATLTGAVNPDHLATKYHFEYASQAAYARAGEEGKRNPYIDGHSTPAGETSSGASLQALAATPVAELEAGTTYHYRLVATNAAGTRYGQDETLVTAIEGSTSTSELTTNTVGTTINSPTLTTTSPSVPSALPPPVVARARQSATRWREGNRLARISTGETPTGTTFTFSLNEKAHVSLDFIELPGGSQGSPSCLARTRKDAKRHSCANGVARGALSFAGHGGTNNVAFVGRISHTDKLRPGRYELAITATNSAGERSRPVSLSFTIVR